jgi:hypothetical protein
MSRIVHDEATDRGIVQQVLADRFDPAPRAVRMLDPELARRHRPRNADDITEELGRPGEVVDVDELERRSPDPLFRREAPGLAPPRSSRSR